MIITCTFISNCIQANVILLSFCVSFLIRYLTFLWEEPYSELKFLVFYANDIWLYEINDIDLFDS